MLFKSERNMIPASDKGKCPEKGSVTMLQSLQIHYFKAFDQTVIVSGLFPVSLDVRSSG